MKHTKKYWAMEPETATLTILSLPPTVDPYEFFQTNDYGERWGEIAVNKKLKINAHTVDFKELNE